MTYPTPPGTGEWLRRVLDLVGEVECVSVGGTPTASSVHELGIATELRVGTYVYGDRACIANGSVPLEDCALRVLATVVSTPTRDRAIVDAGSKALTSDLAEGTTGHGLLLEHPVSTGPTEAWVDMSPPDAPSIIGVCLNEAGGYAVGEFGYVASRGASGWSTEPTGLDAVFGVRSLHSVWLDPDGGVWAAGGQVRVPPLTDGLMMHRGDDVPVGDTLR
jgi:hypothetical protein